MKNTRKKLLFLSSLGGLLEFYDFIIYALFSVYISKAFFPTGNHITELVATFATFSVGFLARPFGGALFGHFGDKHGRKATFTFSILLMATSTFCIALVPTYNHIGILAPIILIVLRILQGLSVGGEVPGAIVYAGESVPEKKGFACGFVVFGLLNGVALGSIVQALLSIFLTEQQLSTWGWRLPFLLGGAFGFWSYHLRKRLSESPLFESIRSETENFPVFKLFRHYSVKAVASVLVLGLGATLTTLLFFFISAYLSGILNIAEKHYIWYQTISLFLSGCLCIVFGAITDRIRCKPLLFTACILAILLPYPIFTIYVSGHVNLFFLAFLLSTLLVGFTWGAIPSYLVELFPISVRYSGVALAYGIGLAISGGVAPLVVILLTKSIGKTLPPVFCISVAAILAFFGLLMSKTKNLNTNHRGLHNKIENEQ